MAKFSGYLGYGVPTKTAPGVWKDVVTEKHYFGDVLRNSRQQLADQAYNPDRQLNNSISLLADSWLNSNFSNIVYIKWKGQYWQVASATVDPDRPHILIQFGGVYNGDKATVPDTP